MNKEEILENLKRLAHLRSKPFCYSCYTNAPSGCCDQCGSDDLMRVVEGVGCEYGYDWIIKEILKEIGSADADERFENFMREVYPENTQIGWLNYDTVLAIKNLDPISWDIAKSEWLDSEESEEILVSFDNGSTYFDCDQLQSQLSSIELELISRESI